MAFCRPCCPRSIRKFPSGLCLSDSTRLHTVVLHKPRPPPPPAPPGRRGVTSPPPPNSCSERRSRSLSSSASTFLAEEDGGEGDGGAELKDTESRSRRFRNVFMGLLKMRYAAGDTVRFSSHSLYSVLFKVSHSSTMTDITISVVLYIIMTSSIPSDSV